MKTIPPYFWLYTSFCTTAKRNGQQNTLTFEDFLTFVQVKNCHYCERSIEWQPKAFRKVATRQYKANSRCYYLDRIDNDRGYVKENCVVCCTVCNGIKGNRLTYDEMLILRPSLIELANHHAMPEFYNMSLTR